MGCKQHGTDQPDLPVYLQNASANRPSWFPGSKLPDHLNGTLPGDFGFDPLGLGVDPANLAW
jgi:hypothetical protein